MNKIVKNIITSAFVLVFATLLANHAFAADGWTAQIILGQMSWTSITSSLDGINLMVTNSDGYIYKSTDSGMLWSTTTAPNKYWKSIASSLDGAYMVAADSDPDNILSGSGYIYIY